MSTVQAASTDIFETILDAARKRGPLRAAVVAPTDYLSLGGTLAAANAGLIEPLLVGDARSIRAAAERCGQTIDPSSIRDAAPGDEARVAALRSAGEEYRARAVELAAVVSLETGKTRAEAVAEVLEAADLIDTYCDQLEQHAGYRTPLGQLDEHEHNESVLRPYGVFGVIAPFNFPVALATGMAAAALLGSNTVVLKPSDKTPLTALAVQAIFERVAARFGDAPAGLSNVLIGGRDLGEALVDDPRVALISATGSTAMGRAVGERAARRFARSILELGGNNAAIVCPSANLDLTVRAVSFAAMGTAVGHVAFVGVPVVPVPAQRQSWATTQVAPCVPGGAGATGMLSHRYWRRFLPIVPM